MTENKLLQLAKKELVKLARIMRLNNWTFTISVVSALSLRDADAWAEIWANYEIYDANIKLSESRWLYKLKWDDKEAVALRQVITHELVHLLFGIQERFADKTYKEEWICEMVANAIINAMGD